MSGCLNKSDRNIGISSCKILTNCIQNELALKHKKKCCKTLDKTQKNNENTQILKST